MPMVPITLAAVGPHTLRMAGEVADGVRLHGFCTRRYMTEVIMPRLSEGLARGGRDRSQFEITGGGFIATGPDARAVAKMIEYTRGRIAFYGSTPAYWPVLELHGFGDLGRKLNAMSKAGRWPDMAGEVPDDVVELFTAIGTHQEIVATIERRFGGLSDALNVGGTALAPSGMPSDLLTDIKRVPARFTGYRTPW
jgi:alkanesulfonate monooxygenase SsuD/methylene tetrahydromethanopterin reductase-like flavin-dependent oxidoreductase (luciferase family)